MAKYWKLQFETYLAEQSVHNGSCKKRRDAIRKLWKEFQLKTFKFTDDLVIFGRVRWSNCTTLFELEARKKQFKKRESRFLIQELKKQKWIAPRRFTVLWNVATGSVRNVILRDIAGGKRERAPADQLSGWIVKLQWKVFTEKLSAKEPIDSIVSSSAKFIRQIRCRLCIAGGLSLDLIQWINKLR